MVQQFYETRVIDEFVLRGNTATLKCLVPSFVADFVDVIEWVAEDGSTYNTNNQQEKGTYCYWLHETNIYRDYVLLKSLSINFTFIAIIHTFICGSRTFSSISRIFSFVPFRFSNFSRYLHHSTLRIKLQCAQVGRDGLFAHIRRCLHR